MKKSEIRVLVLSAIFLSLGIVLPLLTGQLKEIGDTLLPMHIPVLLCGLICNKKYGFLIGITMPFLRSAIFGMPPIYPNAVWMALELATYGFVVGLMYSNLKSKNIFSIYISLATAMICGRIVWGISKLILYGISGKIFSFSMFLAGAFIDALPGIILQFLLIPLIIQILEKRRRIK